MRAPATTETTPGTGNISRPVPFAGCSAAAQAPCNNIGSNRHAGSVRLMGHGQEYQWQPMDDDLEDDRRKARRCRSRPSYSKAVDTTSNIALYPGELVPIPLCSHALTDRVQSCWRAHRRRRASPTRPAQRVPCTCLQTCHAALVLLGEISCLSAVMHAILHSGLLLCTLRPFLTFFFLRGTIDANKTPPGGIGSPRFFTELSGQTPISWVQETPRRPPSQASSPTGLAAVVTGHWRRVARGAEICLSAWQYPTLHYGKWAVVALPLSVPGRGVAGGAGSPLSPRC